MTYIGKNEVKSTAVAEKTVGGIDVVEVTYMNGEKEYLSKLLYDKVVSGAISDDTNLRDKRIIPMVEATLVLLRDWGIKLSELPYFSAMLNNSIEKNHQEALNELWKPWVYNINHPEQVDMIAMDRVLRTKKKTIGDILHGK